MVRMAYHDVPTCRLASAFVWLAVALLLGTTFAGLMLTFPLLALSNGAIPIWALLVGLFALMVTGSLIAGRWAIPYAKRLWRRD